MVRPGSSGLRSIPTLSQDTGISVYSNESTTSITSSYTQVYITSQYHNACSFLKYINMVFLCLLFIFIYLPFYFFDC